MKKSFMERMNPDGSLDAIVKHCLRRVTQGEEGNWQLPINDKQYCIMSGTYCPLQYDDKETADDVISWFACMTDPYKKDE